MWSLGLVCSGTRLRVFMGTVKHPCELMGSYRRLSELMGLEKHPYGPMGSRMCSCELMGSWKRPCELMGSWKHLCELIGLENRIRVILVSWLWLHLEACVTCPFSFWESFSGAEK